MDVGGHAGWQADSGAGLELGALHGLHHLLVSCLHDSVLTQIQSAHPLHRQMYTPTGPVYCRRQYTSPASVSVLMTET